MAGEAVFIVPGPLDTRTGGSIYDRRMIDGLRRAGWHIDVREVSSEFPFPTVAALADASDTFAQLPSGRIVLVDGLVFSAIPDIADRESMRLRLVALVHLPIAADVTRAPDVAARLAEGERRSLKNASAVIATGRAALQLLARYELTSTAVVTPGTDPAPVARGSEGQHVEMLTVATVHTGKGHQLLLEALASLPHRNWHLTCAGSLTRDPRASTAVRESIRDLDLKPFVTLAGEMDEAALSALYDRADVFVLATLQETYGMAVAEALARGLPIVSTTTGAIPELVGADAGILVPPGDVAPLAAALDRVLGQEGRDVRARLSEGARRARERLRSWDDAALEMQAVLSGIAVNG